MSGLTNRKSYTTYRENKILVLHVKNIDSCLGFEKSKVNKSIEKNKSYYIFSFLCRYYNYNFCCFLNIYSFFLSSTTRCIQTVI